MRDKPGPKMKCPLCGMILQSLHVHDFVKCKCKNQAFVDGGGEYLRCGSILRMPVHVDPPKPE